MQVAPILVTVYHRPDCFARCIEALCRNRLAGYSELHVVSDAPVKAEHELLVKQVRDHARTIRGFHRVHLHFREKNYGAHMSTKRGLEDVFADSDRLIFLEDDIVVADDFLQYINDGLDHYRSDKRIFSIAAYKRPFQTPRFYKHEVFYMENFSPWGFGLWRDRYVDVDVSDFNRYERLQAEPVLFERLCKEEPLFLSILKADSVGRLKALDVRFEYHIHVNRLFSVFPVLARATNTGFDTRGEHCGNAGGFYNVRLNSMPSEVNFNVSVNMDKRIAKRFHAAAVPNLPQRILSKLQDRGLSETIRYYARKVWAKV